MDIALKERAVGLRPDNKQCAKASANGPQFFKVKFKFLKKTSSYGIPRSQITSRYGTIARSLDLYLFAIFKVLFYNVTNSIMSLPQPSDLMEYPFVPRTTLNLMFRHTGFY